MRCAANAVPQMKEVTISIITPRSCFPIKILPPNQNSELTYTWRILKAPAFYEGRFTARGLKGKNLNPYRACILKRTNAILSELISVSSDCTDPASRKGRFTARGLKGKDLTPDWARILKRTNAILSELISVSSNPL
jgi:hypothetical protein